MNQANQKIKPGTATYWCANIALFFAGFVTFSVLYMFQPLMPNLVDEFGITPASASLSLSLATLALALALPLSGSISDSFGRRGMMRIALPAAASLALLSALSLPFSLLLSIRFLQGLILAGVPAVAMAYLHDEIEPRAIGAAMGLYIAGNALGGMSGRIVTVLLTDIWSWRIAVFSLSLICLAMSIGFFRLLPASRNFKRQQPRPHDQIASLLDHLHNKNLVLLFAIGFTIMGCFVTLYNYVTFRLLGPAFNLSQSHVALIFLSYIIGGFSSGIIGTLTDRFGRVRPMYFCFSCTTIGLILTLSSQLVAVIAGIILVTIGFFGAHSIASAWVGFLAGKARGQASSLYLLFYYLGSSISGTAGGFFYHYYGWSAVVLFLCVLTGAAASFAFKLQKDGQRKLQTQSSGRAVCIHH